MRRKLQIGIRKHRRCIELAALLTMCAVWCFTGVMFLQGCGGSGGDAGGNGENLAIAQSTPQPIMQTCEHDGDLWICAEDNSCIKDPATEEVAAVEEVAREIETPEATRRPGGLDQQTPLAPAKFYRVKFTSGAITIIAECGSHVSFNSSETTTTSETSTTAETGERL